MMCDADDDVWRGEVCHMTRAKNAPSNVWLFWLHAKNDGAPGHHAFSSYAKRQ
jgi:hypothetical protein